MAAGWLIMTAKSVCTFDNQGRGLSVQTRFTFGFVFLALMSILAVAAKADGRQVCSVDVDIIDGDSGGTHVRATPGGAIIALLKETGTEDGWIEVHITGQLGDWYEIDQAHLINADLGRDGKVIFHRKGYVHKSVLGVSGMHNGGKIYIDHNSKSRPIDPSAAGDQQVDMLGCWGEFLKVHTKKGTGWTTEACTNMNTTCA
ncbi:MAG TPA: hypothetical protein VGM26_01100 [Rhizomicrobium sp.]|jgi:hypothetical protein